ncbi:MAG: YggS family pyridoxal phosphate-dependent enzyme [Ignavibacteriae bacterium]|nr:YggS family pyridoxal phosphate-dependent enzyme [Ignavibacteriota bacterium]
MIRENIEEIRRRIESACRRSGRHASEVTLLAVSKTFLAGAVDEAVSAGLNDVGENYVQELLEKREALKSRDVRWHFIGHLQSNKVKYIAEWIHLIHSLDNAGLAHELDKRAEQVKRTLDVLVEVNTTDEQSKFGVRPEKAVEFVRSLTDLSHIRLAGLMTIGPFLPDPEGSRPMFRTLRQLRDEIAALHQQNVTMQHLSMGMTGDFEVAIDEGATIVRIGTAIFGKREKKR